MGIGLEMTHSHGSESVRPAQRVPSGLRTNILKCLWVYLHLCASFNTYKGCSGESWGKEEWSEVRG